MLPWGWGHPYFRWGYQAKKPRSFRIAVVNGHRSFEIAVQKSNAGIIILILVFSQYYDKTLYISVDYLRYSNTYKYTKLNPKHCHRNLVGLVDLPLVALVIPLRIHVVAMLSHTFSWPQCFCIYSFHLYFLLWEFSPIKCVEKIPFPCYAKKGEV